MASSNTTSPYPSVDRIAHFAEVQSLGERHGRVAVIDAIRAVLDSHRVAGTKPDDARITAEVGAILRRRAKPELRRVFNLTGTVLHTNLGRALLSEAAIDHAAMAMRQACNLEFDISSGERGDRDALVEDLLIELTGAQAATVVNNNAAAVLLMLAALAYKREVVLSRGELIEIGGAFRIPDVMRSAGAKLIEVGTTNRTHRQDYNGAIGPKTAALMKVHCSNYAVTGFVASVSEAQIAEIAHAHHLPLIVDLGAGSLIDLTGYGLPKEPVVRDVIAAGADVASFSGDKLLGGPQAGLIVGKKVLIDRIKRHPLKRALRVSKPVLAALEATLIAYRTPDLLARDLPTLRMLTRPVAEIEALAQRMQPKLAAALGDGWTVRAIAVSSQVGSGSLPVDVIPSMALALAQQGRTSGAALKALAQRLRCLPIPVIGRMAEGSLLLDLRCLEDEGAFLAQLTAL